MFLALMGPQEGIEMAESIGLAKFSIGQLFVLFLLMLNTLFILTLTWKDHTHIEKLYHL